MKLEDYRTLFIALGLIGTFVLLIPAIVLVLPLPGGESFSELWILGPGHMAEDYPFNVKAGEQYSIYLGIGNNIGSSTYYVARVKFRNATESSPNATSGTASSLPILYEKRVFLQDGATWEMLVSFAFNNVTISDGICWVDNLIVNNVGAKVDKLAYWNAQDNGYFFSLFIELYVYRTGSDSLEYDNRFVGIWLNMTGV